MSDSRTLDQFLNEVDPKDVLRPRLNLDQGSLLSLPVAQGFAYRPAVPAHTDPTSNDYLETAGSGQLGLPDRQIQSIWQVLIRHAFMSDPVLGRLGARLARLEGYGDWEQLRRSGAAKDVIAIVAVRVKALLAGCRETVAYAATQGVAFRSTRREAADGLHDVPNWWLLPEGGVDPAVGGAIRSVKLDSVETWSVFAGLDDRGWAGPLAADSAVVGISPPVQAPDADVPHTLAADNRHAFLVANGDAGLLPAVLTRVSTIYR
jgi:hypothetical protein